MSDNRDAIHVSRRCFLQAGALGGGAILLSRAARGRSVDAASEKALPRRVLGRTKLEVTVYGLGTWPSGKCDAIGPRGVASLVSGALDLGVNYIDAARAYENAEEGIGMALGKRRDEVILTSKVYANDAAGARKSFEQSLRALRTDHVDILFIHSVGDRDVQQVMAADGALSYLLRQKEAGKTRFLGISGHSRPNTFLPLVETDQIDVIMVAMNFVDRHIYGFEEKVLPAARRRNLGIACMKVFGGMRGGFGVADGPDTGPQMGTRYLQQAVDYAMELPDVATLVIGVHTLEQLRQNVEMIKNHQPLSKEELAGLLKTGRRLAAEWGEHYGPVA